jgi:hypothetical protein
MTRMSKVFLQIELKDILLIQSINLTLIHIECDPHMHFSHALKTYVNLTYQIGITLFIPV